MAVQPTTFLAFISSFEGRSHEAGRHALRWGSCTVSQVDRHPLDTTSSSESD